MKKFTIQCTFGDQKAPFVIYVGEPATHLHPLQFQSKWLTDRRGGTIPPEVMDSFAKLQRMAVEHNVPFEDLCVYALGTAAAAADKKAEST